MLHAFTVRNQTFNILKVLERGPLRLVKVTFTRHLGDIYNVKGLVKVTFNSPFLNLKGPFFKTFKLLKV